MFTLISVLWIECVEFMRNKEMITFFMKFVKETGNPFKIELWEAIDQRKSWNPKYTPESRYVDHCLYYLLKLI